MVTLNPFQVLEQHIEQVVEAKVQEALGDAGKVLAAYEAEKAVLAPILAKVNFPAIVADLGGAGAMTAAEQATLLAFLTKIQAILSVL